MKRVIEMLQYDKIDATEGIDVDKTNKSKECKLCYYQYFRDVGYKLLQLLLLQLQIITNYYNYNLVSVMVVMLSQ